MKALSLPVLLILLASAPLLGGCAAGCGDECGSFEARCCGWEFYKPCDLIEGKRADCDLDPCAVEYNPCAPAPAPAVVVESAPEVVEGPPPAP